MNELRGIDAPRVGLPGAVPPFDYSLIAAGGSNLTYRVTDAAGRRVALRRPPAGARIATAHDMQREWRILEALSRNAPAVPVPAPLAWCGDESVTGAPFYAMAFALGEILRGAGDTAAWQPHDFGVATESRVDTQVALHALDVDAVGLGDLARERTGYVARQLRRWKKQAEASKTRELPLLHELQGRLLRALPPERGKPALVHGDYRFDNTMLGADRRVIAVFDWELATIGDPVADFCWRRPRPRAERPADASAGLSSPRRGRRHVRAPLRSRPRAARHLPRLLLVEAGLHRRGSADAGDARRERRDARLLARRDRGARRPLPGAGGRPLAGAVMRPTFVALRAPAEHNGRVRQRSAALLLATLLSAPFGARAEPLPVRAFFGTPLISEVRMSPSGKRFALIRSSKDTQVLMLRDGDQTSWTPITKLEDPELRFEWLEWESERTILIGAQLKNPFSIGVRDRASRLFAYDVETREMRWLGKRWPLVQTLSGDAPVARQDEILHWLPQQVGKVLISYRDPTQKEPSARTLSMGGKLGSAQGRSVGVHQWHADFDGVVRAGTGRANGSYALWARRSADADMEKVEEFARVAGDGASFASFTRDPDKLLIYTTTANGRKALAEYDLAAHKLGATLFAHLEVDAGPVEVDAVGRRPSAVLYFEDGPKRHFLDAEAQREMRALQKALGGFVEFVDQSDDAGLALVETSSDTAAPSLHLYDRRARDAHYLFSYYPALDGVKLSPWQSVRYTARDGLEIPALLTLPVGSAAKQLPVIVLVHGGPGARAIRGWDAEVAFLASRGFAVFQPNFRGSTGYGDAFREAGYQQWGLAMQDDLSDGVAWLIAQGIADPDRVGIYGASYGGYAALMGLVKTPELFRAGASYAGVTSIPGLIADDSWYEFFGDDWHAREIGSDDAALGANSPLENVDKIRAPVLLGHGENDWRIHVKHAREFADALRDAGKPVEYLEFEHEVHGFVLEANRIGWYEALAAFLEKNLAPRAAAATH